MELVEFGQQASKSENVNPKQIISSFVYYIVQCGHVTINESIFEARQRVRSLLVPKKHTNSRDSELWRRWLVKYYSCILLFFIHIKWMTGSSPGSWPNPIASSARAYRPSAVVTETSLCQNPHLRRLTGRMGANCELIFWCDLTDRQSVKNLMWPLIELVLIIKIMCWSVSQHKNKLIRTAIRRW